MKSKLHADSAYLSFKLQADRMINSKLTSNTLHRAAVKGNNEDL
jgi:hypothetical protein